METEFTRLLGIKYPIICGAMYPCSNLELVAAVSEAGGIGIIQPLSIVYAGKTDFRKGIARIRELTKKPIGMNIEEHQRHSLTTKQASNYGKIDLVYALLFG